MKSSVDGDGTPVKRPSRAEGDRVLWITAAEAVSPAPVAAALDEVAVETVASVDAGLDRLDTDPIDGVVVGGVTEPAATLERLRERGVRAPVVLVVAGAASVGGETLDGEATLFVPGAEPVPALASAITEALETRERRRQPIQDLPTAEELRLKERAMDEAPVGITISDMSRPDNPLIYVNEAFESVTGYTAAESLGSNCRFLQGPDTDAETVDGLRAAIEREESTTVELRNYRKDGEEFWNRLQVSPIAEGEETTHYVGFQTDVTERKQVELALRRERERLDHLVGRLYGLVTETTGLLTAADSREEIEREVASRFGADAEYDLAWVGRYDSSTARVLPVEAAGTGRSPTDRQFDLGADEHGAAAIAEAVDSGDPVVTTEGIDELSLGAMSDASAVIVPIIHREAVYGVLTVLGPSRELFDGRDRDVLSMLGRSIGSAVNAVGSKRLISTDTVVAVTVDLTAAETFPFRLAAAADCELAYETSRYDPDGEFVGLFTVRGTDPDRLCAIATEDDRVVDTRILAETDDGAVVQFRLPDAPLVRLLADYGAHLEDVTADGAAGRLSFEVSDETSARALVERLEDAYGAELAAYREGAPDRPTVNEFQSAIEERLSDRQSTALRRAYASGFFEWPRDVDGERLAEAMGVSPPTFHQHLRTAQRKMFDELFDS